MRTKLSRAIREARLATRLTQEQLGRRLGLKGRAVYRWESGHSEPQRRHRRALVTAIRAMDVSVATQLEAALASESDGASAAPARTNGSTAGTLATAGAEHAAPTLAAPAVLGESRALELLLFRMADELDLPPRRMRGALARLLRGMRTENLSFETAERDLEAWIARAT